MTAAREDSLLKWFPDAFGLLRRLDRAASEGGGIVFDFLIGKPSLDLDAAEALIDYGMAAAEGFLSERVVTITDSGRAALARFDGPRGAGFRAFHGDADEDAAPVDHETLPLDFDAPRRLPAFGFRNGK